MLGALDTGEKWEVVCTGQLENLENILDAAECFLRTVDTKSISRRKVLLLGPKAFRNERRKKTAVHNQHGCALAFVW